MAVEETKAPVSGKMRFLLMLIFYLMMSTTIHWKVNQIQPAPYMDEIFHVPQCQKYCSGLYSEWDPKITTLPGTYIVTTAVLRTIDKVIPIDDPCSTLNLRAFNFGVSVVNLVMIYYIIGYYSPEECATKRAVAALNIATFPVLYFFSFLYYTDAVSTAFLLLMHWMFLKGRFGFSALAGGWSVLTRQTNIIWVMYHGINSILEVLTEKFGEIIFLYPMEYKRYLLGGPLPTKPKTKAKRPSKAAKRSKKSLKSNPPFPSIRRIWQECGDDFGDRGCAYVFVGMSFLMFVVYNGSIVVGDKQAHQATVNFPQLGYFALVFGTFTSPFLLLRMRTIIRKVMQVPLSTVLFLVLFGALIYYNTPVHPYLLADNRHYTFYIWKRFYAGVPCFRFLWIPFYILVWMYLIANMGVQTVYLFTFFLCAALNIVPQLLMEFRYFIPGYLFARMTFRNATWSELLLEFALHQVVNLVTVYLFLYRPFKWPDSADDQRFMW